MDIGDQVLYIFNEEIDLDRDLGKITDWWEETPNFFTVRFNDGFEGLIHKDDLRRVVVPQEKRMHHGYFGCLEDPCPEHNSTSNDQK